MTTSTEWNALAKRCEAATGPDRGLDIAVHRAAHPWLMTAIVRESEGDTIIWRKTEGEPAPNPTGWYTDECGRYSDSLDAIVALIERELPGWWWQVESAVHDGDRMNAVPKASIGHYLFDVAGCDDVEAATPALALCASLCRAMAAKCEERGE